MEKVILEDLELQLGVSICEHAVVHGGDINDAFKLSAEDGRNYFLKVNSSGNRKGIIESEVKGLELLKSKNIRVPKVLAANHLKNHSYLCLAWLNAENKNDNDLAEQLVLLHSQSKDYYGLDLDNFIGSLPQKNTKYSTFHEYYINCRLEPQIKLASDDGFHLPNVEKFYANLKSIIPEEQPALIHGDLWNGNYMVNGNEAYLIDPSVSYNHREMDLAMMHLFGGFDSSVLSKYIELFPLIAGWIDRLDVFQLYYLLVHLNLFGVGYYKQVENIIRKYS